MNKRRRAVWTLIVALSVAFFLLGEVRRSDWIGASPDGRFAVHLVAERGWRRDLRRQKYRVYVTDSQTRESVVAAVHPEYCGFEWIVLNRVRWGASSRSFVCDWEIQYNGVHEQRFAIRTQPLRVEASAPCCMSL